VTILTNYSKQLTGKNLLARFSINSLGNTKLIIIISTPYLLT